MEPRAAVAEWADGRLTVWTASQQPFGVRAELARAFRLTDDRVRVIIPDFGGGFGGKHSGECAVEAARLAKAAGAPVRLQWTRAEEFTWAVFRPAAAIDVEASLDESGRLTSWHFLNFNSGSQEVQTPYRTGRSEGRFVESSPPLRHGSYRALVADPDVDVVYVATPHPQHRAVALAALAHGKAVLVEKSFTVTPAATREIVASARAAGRFAMEAMWTRFHPAVARLRGGQRLCLLLLLLLLSDLPLFLDLRGREDIPHDQHQAGQRHGEEKVLLVFHCADL